RPVAGIHDSDFYLVRKDGIDRQGRGRWRPRGDCHAALVAVTLQSHENARVVFGDVGRDVRPEVDLRQAEESRPGEGAVEVRDDVPAPEREEGRPRASLFDGALG